MTPEPREGVTVLHEDPVKCHRTVQLEMVSGVSYAFQSR